MAKPIQLKSHTVLIDAPRELVFQKLSSIGRGKMKGDTNESSSIILRDESPRLPRWGGLVVPTR